MSLARSALTIFALLSFFLAGCEKISSSQDAQDSEASNTPLILLFDGKGTSLSDVAAIQNILRKHSLDYATVDSQHLNELSVAQMRRYRLLIVPGGNFEEIGNNLSTVTTANVRAAVKNGLNYFGICAGAFFAGNSPYNGLNITEGVRFGFYSLERENIRKAAVAISIAGSSTLDHYWEDGPQLTGWGNVVAKYPDGTPAIAEGSVEDGWVILSGVHPEAPESWRRGMAFSTSTSVDSEYAALLIDAALNRKQLPHY